MVKATPEALTVPFKEKTRIKSLNPQYSKNHSDNGKFKSPIGLLENELSPIVYCKETSLISVWLRFQPHWSTFLIKKFRILIVCMLKLNHDSLLSPTPALYSAQPIKGESQGDKQGGETRWKAYVLKVIQLYKINCNNLHLHQPVLTTLPTFR